MVWSGAVPLDGIGYGGDEDYQKEQQDHHSPSEPTQDSVAYQPPVRRTLASHCFLVGISFTMAATNGVSQLGLAASAPASWGTLTLVSWVILSWDVSSWLVR